MSVHVHPKPYADESCNFFYNLLFCDDPTLFAPKEAESLNSWKQLLVAETPDATALRTLAENESMESRIRVLAYNCLRRHGEEVPKRKLLGVIVEVSLERGLDTLAAYQDGRIRYINQAEKLAIFEASPVPVAAKVNELMVAAQLVVNQIGPWDGARLEPPKGTDVRMTFLASDGLYLGQGPFEVMAHDSMGGPVMKRASELLQLVVAVAVE